MPDQHVHPIRWGELAAGLEQAAGEPEAANNSRNPCTAPVLTDSGFPEYVRRKCLFATPTTAIPTTSDGAGSSIDVACRAGVRSSCPRRESASATLSWSHAT